jgi:hypothetical protein
MKKSSRKNLSNVFNQQFVCQLNNCKLIIGILLSWLISPPRLAKNYESIIASVRFSFDFNWLAISKDTQCISGIVCVTKNGLCTQWSWRNAIIEHSCLCVCGSRGLQFTYTVACGSLCKVLDDEHSPLNTKVKAWLWNIWVAISQSIDSRNL